MSGIKPHSPLDREGERLLVHIADPVRRAPQRFSIPDPERLELLLAAAARHGVLPAAIRGISDLIEGARDEAGEAGNSAAVEAAGAALDAARLQPVDDVREVRRRGAKISFCNEADTGDGTEAI